MAQRENGPWRKQPREESGPAPISRSKGHLQSPYRFFSVSNENMQVYANAMNTLKIKSILMSGSGSADSNSIPMTPLIIQYPVSSNLP